MNEDADVASPDAGNDDLVGLDDIDTAARALDAAVAEVERAREGVQRAQDIVRTRRDERDAEIVRALRDGARVTAVAAAAGLTREQIRRIAREHGIEAE